MNAKMKRRLVAVSGIIIVVLILVLAFVGGNSAAKTVSVAEAAEGGYAGQKVQVSGNVVEDSFSTAGNTLTFEIYDPENEAGAPLKVVYEGAASSTFGNDVTAICTGHMGEDNVLTCSELVTKCPSKYENATDALEVGQLLGYGLDMVGTMVKVTGTVQDLKAVGQGDRFVITDGTDVLPVAFDGALSEEVVDGAQVVLTGSLSQDGSFAATDVALQA
ncbi:MAG: cytochrome c maturation protein CcmE [Eggerthellaceae bacterium]|nr:cytochrome c maturation protein CcmE [Eggerthellaceae bacterium]